MQYGQLPNIDLPVARLVQGTTMIGSSKLDYSFELLDSVFALGCNTFDMAHGYGQGDVERTFGKWMHSHQIRDQVVIITKGAHHNADRQRVTPYDITADLFDSLARLRIDTIDLYLLHRDDPSVPVEAIIDVLNEHLSAGRIRTFGASNWSHERIQAANQYARANGLAPFLVSSPNFSLADQIQEPWPNCITISGAQGKTARDWYLEEKMPLFTWSSMAGGFFSGRFRRDNLDSFTSAMDRLCVTSYCSESNFKRLDRAEKLAKQKGFTLPQVALAFVWNQPLDIYALVGHASKEECMTNIEALNLQFTQEELDWLDLKRDEV